MCKAIHCYCQETKIDLFEVFWSKTLMGIYIELLLFFMWIIFGKPQGGLVTAVAGLTGWWLGGIAVHSAEAFGVVKGLYLAEQQWAGLLSLGWSRLDWVISWKWTYMCERSFLLDPFVLLFLSGSALWWASVPPQAAWIPPLSNGQSGWKQTRTIRWCAQRDT